MDGWANLGAVFGGDSEKSYQEGLALGAQTENALAQARQRVEQNAARARMEQDLVATGLGRNEARAASTALSAGAGLTDPMSLMLKNQEFDIRRRASDPNLSVDERQIALHGLANAPIETIYKVGNRAFNKFETPANIDDLGAVFGGDGSQSAQMQLLDRYGFPAQLTTEEGPFGRIAATDLIRDTFGVTDAGGAPVVFSRNPRAQYVPGASPTPQATPLVPVPTVAQNRGTIAAATEQGQAQGRNAAGLQSALATFDKFEQDIDGLLSKKGFTGLYGNIQGTDLGKMAMGLAYQDVADARGALDTLGGEAFLASIQKMRGFGQLSNQEGLKVQTALTRALDTRISEDEARRAWDEVKKHLAELRRVAAIEAGQAPSGAAPAAPADAGGWQTINGVRIRVKPQ